MARARQAAEKALELDPDLPMALSAMGSVLLHGDWDFARAEQLYLRALDLEPGLVIAHQQYAVMLGYLGRNAEAIEHLEIARDLDPQGRDPGSIDLGYMYARNGQSERAIASWIERERLAPSYLSTYVRHGRHLCQVGRYDEGIVLLTKAIAAETTWPVASLAYCYGLAGRRDEAIAKLGELRELAEKQYVTPVSLALVHVGLGDADAAFAALDRAYEFRAPGLLALRTEPRWRPLHEDPRFQDLLRRIGIPESDAAADGS